MDSDLFVIKTFSKNRLQILIKENHECKESISLDRSRTIMGSCVIELYGQTNAVDHERCYANRHPRTSIRHQFWPLNGYFPLDLWFYESGSGFNCRPD